MPSSSGSRLLCQRDNVHGTALYFHIQLGRNSRQPDWPRTFYHDSHTSPKLDHATQAIGVTRFHVQADPRSTPRPRDAAVIETQTLFQAQIRVHQLRVKSFRQDIDRQESRPPDRRGKTVCRLHRLAAESIPLPWHAHPARQIARCLWTDRCPLLIRDSNIRNVSKYIEQDELIPHVLHQVLALRQIPTEMQAE